MGGLTDADFLAVLASDLVITHGFDVRSGTVTRLRAIAGSLPADAITEVD